MNRLIHTITLKHTKASNVGVSFSIYRHLHTAPSSHGHSKPPFEKILIANRGEIACRVMRTAKKMGIKTVAVYSEADQHALHVRAADEAVCVGPAPTSQSYLNVEKIMEAIKKTGAQAVHPGYGFLSENSKFVKELENAGVAFIGPGSYAMHAMGDKIESKKIAKKANVNIIPGFLGEVDSMDEVLRIANEIGYPVMVKASAGGGGKGMRICWNDEDVKIGFRLSKQEAKSSFGDDRMLIEKFIDNGRHIEIQVLADGKNAIFFPERECSIQRRNQKVIEEAPSPLLDDKTRRAMGEQATSLCTAVGYKSAGTVEFIVDNNKNFYFLEMNTRLQVEHPITEYITGVDLVEHMIRIAAGDPLSIQQKDIGINGWAFESRVYAEDPFRNFLPSIGKLTSYERPVGEHVRIDGGVYEGGEISIYYDPLISKLVTWGKTRKEGIDTMSKALDEYIIRGVNHNVPFLRAVMENKRFIEGRLTTKFIPEEFPDGFQGYNFSPIEIRRLISTAASMKLKEHQHNSFSSITPDHLDLVISFNEVDYHVKVQQSGNEYTVTFENDKDIQTVHNDWKVGATLVHGQVNKVPLILQVIKKITLGYQLQYLGSKTDVLVRTPRQFELAKYMPVKKHTHSTNSLNSPMPGSVISVAVKEGDKVILGQELVVVEAMKMQNVLRASHDCTIKSIQVKPGQSVAVDEVLIEFA